jgi:thioredoxin-related protein
MKSLIILIALGISLISGEIRYEHHFDQALQKAKTLDKKVLMLYSAAWCPECNYMKEVVFNENEVSEYIEQHFVVLILDIQKDDLPKEFDYIGIPTFFIIDKEGKEKNRIVGGDKAAKFLKRLKEME